VRWRDLEEQAPQIAAPGRERLEQTRLALLGTLRLDGSPRISPVEPYFTRDDLVFGAMAWSAKRHDLLREPRCVLHSVVTGPDDGDPELKLYGRAAQLEGRMRKEIASAWWVGRPDDQATVFGLRVEQAVFVLWDSEGGEVTIRRWSARRGASETRRLYP
jgi:Pyridoxamine 5'-phosphate oxidase